MGKPWKHLFTPSFKTLNYSLQKSVKYCNLKGDP